MNNITISGMCKSGRPQTVQCGELSFELTSSFDGRFELKIFESSGQGKPQNAVLETEQDHSEQ